MSPWRADRPHDTLPPLPPAADVETKPILRRCIEARAALGELKLACELIPNQAMLINLIPTLEARASSEIENIVTTADRVFRHLEDDGNADPATREALRHRVALMRGLESLDTRPLCTRTAEIVCSHVKDTEMSVRRVPGTALANATTGEVIYTPPEGEKRIREMLANWEHFLHAAEGPDPLIRMAVGHYQFEAIHPFVDGNGRTGRILNSIHLVEKGLLTLPVLYLSRHFIRHRAEYHAGLLEVTRAAAWEPWILFVLSGVEETARWTLAKVAAIRGLINASAQYVSTALPKVYSRELVDVLFTQPYCRISHLVDSGIAKRQTASTYLRKLTDIGFMTEEVAGRDKLFVNRRLLQVLENEDDTCEPLRPPARDSRG
ncbi:MAG: Fic family protein [Planctomycetota bacterium]